ncbi:MAG: ribosome maturation factor RimM [Ornithinimicrobium sp.]
MGLDQSRARQSGRRVVARVGRPHGLRGEVTVELRTDDPERRLAAGTALAIDVGDRGSLTVRTVRVHQGVYLLGFQDVTDRSEAEALRGLILLGDDQAAPVAAPRDEDEFYEDDLVGLSVELTTGEVLGEVSALHTRPAQDLLEIRRSDDARVLVPFVTALVPVVDLDAGRIVVDPPPGLLELDT